MNRDKQTIIYVLAFVLGWVFATHCQAPVFSGEFKLSVEEGYGGGTDGVRFINLSGSEGYQPLTFAGDAGLPLTKFLVERNGRRVKITIEDAPARDLQQIVR